MTDKQEATSSTEHLEHAAGASDAEKASATQVRVASIDSEGLVKSRFDTLTITQALWVFRRSLLVCAAVFTGNMLQYFEIILSSAILANPGFILEFGDAGRGQGGVADLDPTWVSAWSAIVNVGQIVTIFFISFFTERFGRKPSLMAGWFLIAMAMVCLTVARSPGVWLLGRFFTGCGTGIVSVVAAPYGMEICATRIRGIVLSAAIFWGAVATLMASIMMNYLTINHPFNWHLPVYAVWGPVGFMGIAFAVIPETPWFHARRGNKDKAMKVLKFLYGNIEGYDFEEEFGIMTKTIELERENIRMNKASPWTDLFRGINGKRTLTTVIFAASIQFGGYPLFYGFATYTYALAGFSNPFQTIIITASVQCGIVLFMVMTFDKFGRRMFVTWAYSGQAISLLLWGCMHYVPLDAKGRIGALTFVTCCWAVTATFTANSQTIYSAELPSAYLRIKTGVMCQILFSCLGIAANFATPPMLLHLGLRSGFVFFAFSVPIAAFLWIYLPETKVPAWRWSKTKTHAETQLEKVMQAREAEAEAQRARGASE